MSEDEGKLVGQNDEEQDEVEAHRTGRIAATDEGEDTEGDDDFEAHRTGSKRPPRGV